MTRAQRYLQLAKTEMTISFVSVMAVIGIGSQVKWLAEDERVFLALACIAIVMSCSVLAMVAGKNAVRFYLIAREERQWEIKYRNNQ